MAEHKIYKCDICQKLDAIHLEISDVNKYLDDNNNYVILNGYVDLCADCIPIYLNRAVVKVINNRVDRNRFFRELTGINTLL